MTLRRLLNLLSLSRPLGGARRARSRAAFTMLELQVAVILLAFGVVTLASLMTTQARLMKRVQGNYTSGATVVLTRNTDPWVKQLSVPARITANPITPTSPPVITAHNSVSFVTAQTALNNETITVTADVAELP